MGILYLDSYTGNTKVADKYTEWRMEGRGGNDTLFGHNLNDHISGGTGNDWLYGMGGNDTVFGDAGADVLSGNDGNDSLYGGEGSDQLFGDAGTDFLYGDAGHDRLNGGSGGDILSGGSGDDLLNGSLGNDLLYGDGGHDHLIGGTGDDVISGADGNDRIVGEQGTDSLWGGTGADRFEYTQNGGTDRIKDFNRAQGDKIVIDVAGFDSWFSLTLKAKITAYDNDGNGTKESTLVNLGNAQFIVVENVTSLNSVTDFLFI